MRVAIAGAGAVGRSIATELLENGHEVLLIDRDPKAIKVDLVPDAEWLLADACEMSSLQEAQLHRCHVVVAASGDDKVNLVVSLLAKTEFGVPRVVARVNHPANEQLFNESWGVDVAVSTPRSALRPGRGSGHRRRPGPAVLVQARRGEPGRADAARRLPPARSPGRRRPLATGLRTGRHHPRRSRAGAERRRPPGGRRRAAVRRRPGTRARTRGPALPALQNRDRLTGRQSAVAAGESAGSGVRPRASRAPMANSAATCSGHPMITFAVPNAPTLQAS